MAQQGTTEEARKDGKYPTVESWNDADCKLSVTQPEGWTCKVSMQSRINLPPSELFELLTQPDNSGVFRNIKALKSRRILEDDNRGYQLVEVEQEAKWKFLVFGGTFSTKLYVDQNKRTGHIGFKLREAGLMKKFEGTWKIQPFNQATLDENFGFNNSSKSRGNWLSGPVNVFQGFHRRVTGHQHHEDDSSLLTLEQSVLPGVTPPPPLDRFLKGIAARQVRNLVEDVRKEVDRRRVEKERDKPHPSTSGAPLASLLASPRPPLASIMYRRPPSYRAMQRLSQAPMPRRTSLRQDRR